MQPTEALRYSYLYPVGQGLLSSKDQPEPWRRPETNSSSQYGDESGRLLGPRAFYSDPAERCLLGLGSPSNQLLPPNMVTVWA